MSRQRHQLPSLLCTTIAVVHLFSACGCAESSRAVSSRMAEEATSRNVRQAVGAPSEVIDLETAIPLKSWKYVILHHSATVSGSVESIHRSHLERRDGAGNPWRGIGYHFLIGNGNGMQDGEVKATFRWEEQIAGAHAGDRQFNEFGIGICLVGNFEQSGPTFAQVRAAEALIGQLKAQFGMIDEQILKHGDLKATACPGRLFPFQKIATTPVAGVQLVEGQARNRFSSSETERMEGIKNVASTQRFRAAQKTGSGRQSDENR